MRLLQVTFLLLILAVSQGIWSQDKMTKIETGIHTTTTTYTDGSAKSSSRGVWRPEGTTEWQKYDKPWLPNVGKYLSLREESKQHWEDARSQFKTSQIGTVGAITGGGLFIGGLAWGVFREKDPSEPDFLALINPLTVSGLSLVVGGLVFRTIFQFKGAFSLNDALTSYNKAVENDTGMLRKHKFKPTLDLALGYNAGPSVGVVLNF